MGLVRLEEHGDRGCSFFFSRHADDNNRGTGSPMAINTPVTSTRLPSKSGSIGVMADDIALIDTGSLA